MICACPPESFWQAAGGALFILAIGFSVSLICKWDRLPPDRGWRDKEK